MHGRACTGDSKPGDVHVFQVAAMQAPRIGERLTMHPYCIRLAAGTDRTGFDLNAEGPWQVVLCEPIRGNMSWVSVYIRAL